MRPRVKEGRKVVPHVVYANKTEYPVQDADKVKVTQGNF